MTPRLTPACALGVGLGLLIVAVPAGTARGAAWTRAEGQFLVVVPTSYSVATENFDSDGDRTDRRRFEMVEIAPLAEYGVFDYLTVGAQPKWRYVNVDLEGGGSDSNSGLAEIDFFSRLRLWSEDEAAFSIQGLVKAPIDPDENDAASLGFDQVDVEGSLLFGNRFALEEGKIFYNLDVGYRKRFDTPADEIHGNAFLGWWSGGLWTAVATLNNTVGLDNEERSTLQALTAEPDFRRHQAGLSFAFRFGELIGLPKLSFVAGVSTTYAGENVGATNSGFAALVFSIDPLAPLTGEDIFRSE